MERVDQCFKMWSTKGSMECGVASCKSEQIEPSTLFSVYVLPCDGGDRGKSAEAESKGTSRPPESGRGKQGSSTRGLLQREHGPANILIPDFQPSEHIAVV